jgi:AraC-like DNA-binding protein
LTHSHPGRWAFSLFSECHGRIESLPSEPGLTLSITLEPQALVQGSRHLAGLLTPFLKETRDFTRVKPTFKFGMMNAAMFAATAQVLDCPYAGPCRDLFLEAKVMELLALQMSLVAQKNIMQKPAPLEPDELMAVRLAREILLADLNNPPRLGDLAKKVGINRNKLNQGFRRLYGVTAFEMLRTERLERAKVFLKGSGMSLAEIAQVSGYCAQSHFTSAFTAQFGVTPGRFRKRGRLPGGHCPGASWLRQDELKKIS